jgi:hypothetical protein
MPTRGFEPPHPAGSQILSLLRLPLPPRRPLSAGPDGIIPPILWIPPWCGGEPCRHLSHPGNGVAAPDLPGVTRPHRRRCDETEPWAWPRTRPTRLAPGRTLAQPAMSPRPLVGSYPTGSPLAGYPLPLPCGGEKGAAAGIFSVAVVVRTRLSPACPHLRFRGATLSRPWAGPGTGTGSREVPPDSLCCPATAHPSAHYDYKVSEGRCQVQMRYAPGARSRVGNGRCGI